MGNRSRDALEAQLNPLKMLNRAIGDGEPEVVEVVPENALVKREDGAMTFKRFVMWQTGMEIPADVTKEELLEVGEIIKGLESSIQWVIGDLMNAIEFKWGEGYQPVAEALGYEVKTVYEWAYVCRKVSIRMEKPLSFGHHQLVAKLPADAQVYWLQQAAEEEWSISQMRKAMKGDNDPPERFIPDDVAPDWNFLRSMQPRPRSPEERNAAQIKIDRIRKALDDLQRQLWED